MTPKRLWRNIYTIGVGWRDRWFLRRNLDAPLGKIVRRFHKRGDRISIKVVAPTWEEDPDD